MTHSTQIVSDDYLRGFHAGAAAAIDYLSDQWPDLAQPYDDTPAPTEAIMAHVAAVADVLSGAAPVPWRTAR